VHHLIEVEADFRAFYQLTPGDVLELTGPHFMALAQRLVSYTGAVQAVALAEQEGQHEARPVRRGVDEYVESTPLNLQTNPAFAGLISYGTG
jgi:hypothetical protein